MNYRRLALVSLIIGGTLALSTGCVSKRLFRRNLDDNDNRVGAVESAIEANERRIGDLREETDSKLAEVERKASRAERLGDDAMSTAQRAAKGKLIWDVTLSDERVKFSFGDMTIPDSAASVLRQLAEQIKALDKAVFIEIEGHTDSTGSAGYNLTLGEKRADAVRSFLNEQGGIPLHAMNTISFGESRPVADNDTASGRSQNRRVVIRVLE